MAVSPDQVSALLRRGVPPLVVIAGDAALLIQEAADAVRAAARAAGHDERQIFDVERGFNWQQVVDAGNSLSLFSARRLIEVRVPTTPGDDGAKLLEQLAEAPLADCCVLVTLGSLDGRQRKARWYVACERKAVVIYAWPIKRDEWPQWVAERARREGVALTEDAARLLAERTEGNLLACVQDLRKLAARAADTPVDVETLIASVADNARFGVFDLSDRLLEGDAVGAVRSLQRLREEGISVQEILGGLLWTLRGVARASAAYARSRDLASACDQAGVPRARQASYRAILLRVRATEPLGWLRHALTIDRQSKSTGGEPAAWADLLTLVLAASGAAPIKGRRAT